MSLRRRIGADRARKLARRVAGVSEGLTGSAKDAAAAVAACDRDPAYARSSDSISGGALWFGITLLGTLQEDCNGGQLRRE
jgi:hypothetical protein